MAWIFAALGFAAVCILFWIASSLDRIVGMLTWGDARPAKPLDTNAALEIRALRLFIVEFLGRLDSRLRKGGEA